MQVTIPMLVYGLMYTVALTVEAFLVVVDAPESSLINTEVKNTHKWCLYLNGIAVFHGNSAFLCDKPTTTTLKKAMLPSRAIMSAHGQKKILVRAVDEKQVISL